MNGFLLDTNCISEVVRVRPNPDLIEWVDAADEQALYLSVLTLGEIRKGIENLAESRRRRELVEWLEVDLRKRFANRILPVDFETADLWGRLAGAMRRHGTPLPVLDALLAATAQRYGLTVVSRNTRDFLNAGVSVLNPWQTD